VSASVYAVTPPVPFGPPVALAIMSSDWSPFRVKATPASRMHQCRAGEAAIAAHLVDVNQVRFLFGDDQLSAPADRATPGLDLGCAALSGRMLFGIECRVPLLSTLKPATFAGESLPFAAFNTCRLPAPHVRLTGPSPAEPDTLTGVSRPLRTSITEM
jgi:hypothetical protein